jgi:CubicO group peptidase (beta-lactamase class C family)
MSLVNILIIFSSLLLFSCRTPVAPEPQEPPKTSENLWGHWDISQELRDECSEMATILVNDNQIPSMVIGVVTPQIKGLILNGENLPDENSIYALGSITKVFTGLLFARKVVDGPQELNTLLSSHLPPSLSVLVENRTFGQVVSHYSGYKNMPGNVTGNARDGIAKDYSLDDLKTCLSSALCSGRATPGVQYIYSNIGLGLLGVSLSFIDGRELTSIYEPMLNSLDMNTTLLARNLTDFHEPYLVKSYDSDGEMDFATMGVLATAGELVSNGRDMLNFVEAFSNPSLYPDYQEYLNKAVEVIRPGIAYAINIEEDSNTGENYFYKTGGTPGTSAVIVFDPNKRLGMFVLTNKPGLTGLLKEFLVELKNKLARESSKSS